jgi:membrane protease YdiL (CAAX protease family)
VGELALAGSSSGAPDVGSRRAYPWLLDGRRERGGWSQAALLGVAGGLATTVVFVALDVQDGPAVQLLQRMFPKLAQLSAAASLAVTLPAVVGAAVSEELFFRGLVQAWLTRWFGGTRRAVVLAVALASARAGGLAASTPRLSCPEGGTRRRSGRSR